MDHLISVITFGEVMNRPEINIRLVSGNVLLTITFVVLKALGYIDWSWVWVLCPMWIPLAMVLSIILVPTLIAAVFFLIVMAGAGIAFTGEFVVNKYKRIKHKSLRS